MRHPIAVVDNFLGEAQRFVLRDCLVRSTDGEHVQHHKNPDFDGRQVSYAFVRAPAAAAIMDVCRRQVARLGAALLGYPALYPTFTDLVRWPAGSSIGWHTDDAPDYFPWRRATGVLVLNGGYEGGEVLIQDDPDDSTQVRVVGSQPGRLIVYPSAAVHRLEPVAEGERFTLAMWATHDRRYTEYRNIAVS